jgi:hypothetical protein
MSPQVKRRVTMTLAVVAIVAACAWIYITQTSDARHNEALHRHIGKVLAEQTAEVAGNKGKIVTLAIDTKDWPELNTQLAAFKTALKKLGNFDVRDYEMDTKDQPKYGVGSGLSGRRYVRTVNKNTNATVFVSFIGAPKLSKEDLAELTIKPRLVAEVRSVENLPKLFQQQMIDIAIVSRFQYPAPAPRNPRTAEEWFTKRYQIVTAQTVGSIPKPEKD